MDTAAEETYELWPTEHARSLIESLTEYLTTTFALSDSQAADNLKEFLGHPDDGMFKGPYVRLRLPFAADASDLDADGRPRSLDFYPADYAPYGHQLAAFNRLSTKPRADTDAGPFRTPDPTLVTTGTGSGKTEAFLFPILDHVLRAKREGITGTKALILYPMNALANDQADRLAQLITTHPELTGVRAAIYTGQKTQNRATVSTSGLITDRHTIRDEPPDILLTNYKMLDQMLLRGEDQHIWSTSATSLQYLVLDEFHTYDGAQGTDVAMLLRRLGAALKSHWPTDLSTQAHGPAEDDRNKPLGHVTPVATSATLGGGAEEAQPNAVDPSTPQLSDPRSMVSFARTVFGVTLDPEAVIPETRLGVAEWLAEAADTSPTPRTETEIAGLIVQANNRIRATEDRSEHIGSVLNVLFEDHVAAKDPQAIQTALKTHPWTKRLLSVAAEATSLTDIAAALIPSTFIAAEHKEEFTSHLLAVFSHVRKHLGRSAATVETHLWIRELTRLDSELSHSPGYSWSDDGHSPAAAESESSSRLLPAVYCRHCGSRGWAGLLTPDGASLHMDPAAIREASIRRDAKFRALMDAGKEIDTLLGQQEDVNRVPGLRFLHSTEKRFLDRLFTDAGEIIPERQAHFEAGQIIAVRTHEETDAGDLSADQVCPVCDTKDGIRFVGSAIATMLTVAVTGLFGADHLDPAEKKSLVFTDSVQDAAHRAGFIQARSHTFTLRTLLRQALGHLSRTGTHQPHLNQVVETAVELADQRDAAARFLLVPPDVTEHRAFQPYWDPDATPKARATARQAVLRRLQFDSQLEFGLQARFGRTLELTGTAVAEAIVPSEDGGPTDLATVGKAALTRRGDQLSLDPQAVHHQRLAAWVRGVLIRMRLQGGLDHPWVRNYLHYDGLRWHLWGGRRRDQGMPTFPIGRSLPAFPRIGAKEKPAASELDAVTTTEAWYSWWTRSALGVGREESGHLVRALFEQLTEAGALQSVTTKDSTARIYIMTAESLRISLADDAALEAKDHVLQCTACRARTFGTPRIITEMDGAPCMNRRCLGHLKPHAFEPGNYYRSRLYAADQTARVIAREHSSLISDETRVTYEDQFRSDDSAPDAPNVLVATPTLEMGIDIGSLSTVMLSSMPTSVASYVQRIGRAGRLSGNSLALAFVQGRGQHLPKLHDPLSIINGQVRPPATYLEAEEILRRQFIAYCADTLARSTDPIRPRNLAQALRSTEAETYLGRIIADVRAHGPALAEAFLQQFGKELSPSAAEALRHWATREHEDDESPLESRLHTASNQYREDLEVQHRRRETLANEVVPELRKQAAEAENTTATDSKQAADAHRELRNAEAQLRHTRQTIDELTVGEWWVAGLERYGLLPNYALIEDSVELEARVAWRDEDSGQWESEVYPFQRGAESALRDFAPGSTFYAQGLALNITSVELGHHQRELAHWQLCPACGWINKNLTPRTDAAGWNLLAACPRCSTEAIHDTGQILDVVVLSTVTADVQRDEAQISDRTDERLQSSYEIIPAADLDPSTASHQWYVRDFAFGADVLPRATLRWLNLGPRGHHGAKRALAGHEVQSPLFTVCSICGTLARRRENHRDEHKFWCTARTTAERETVSLALARELTTQAVLLHLPDALVDDDYTIPTLKAALLLGLHEAFGGTPAHLGVIDVPESAALTAGGYSAKTLLLHDNVPGGTGYLSEFSDPARVHALLAAAWQKVSTCTCDTPADDDAEPRLACHRCLLPHADRHSMDRVSRSAAERILSTLLTGRMPEPGTEALSPQQVPAVWETTTERPEMEHTSESHLERQFRQALHSRLTAEGAQVEELMRSGKLTLAFTLPGQGRTWQLVPQVDVGRTRPDFRLTAPGVPAVAIYTDGHAYHAVPGNNRLADDAEKRHSLRSQYEHIPWAITHQDVVSFRDGAAAQAGEPQLTWLNQKLMAQADTRLLRAAGTSSMHLLWEWIHRPDAKLFSGFADDLLVASLDQHHSLTDWVSAGPDSAAPDNAAPAEVDSRLLEDTQIDPEVLRQLLGRGMSPTDRWWRRQLGHTDLLVAGSPSPEHRPHIRVAYSLDDADQALAEPTHRYHWREWLLISTLLGFRSLHRTSIVTRGSAETILAAEYSAASSAEPAPEATGLGATVDFAQAAVELSAEWQQLVEEAIDEQEAAALAALGAHQLPLPVVGEEYAGGVTVDIAFPDHRVALLYDQSEDAGLLEAHGWRVLIDPQSDAVAEELRR